MREWLYAQDDEIQKEIEEAAESIPDEEEPSEEDFAEGSSISKEEVEKGLAEVQKRMDEENPER